MQNVFLMIESWLGWSGSLLHVAVISLFLTAMIIIAPVVIGFALHWIEHLQFEILGLVNRRFAYFFVNYLTFPGVFVHEMSHLGFAVIAGAEVNEICMFESGNGRLGHISYRNRGPMPMEMVQNSLSAVAPVVVGVFLGYLVVCNLYTGNYSWWQNLLLVYLLISLVDHSTMSDVDLKLYLHGVWVFVPFIFVGLFVAGIFA